jgi:hypothetical protein
VLFGRVGRAETELGGDLGPGGRKPRVGDVLPDESENFLLSGGEVAHGGWSGKEAASREDCIFIQSSPIGKGGARPEGPNDPGVRPMARRFGPKWAVRGSVRQVAGTRFGEGLIG